jgi:hypothetical protein
MEELLSKDVFDPHQGSAFQVRLNPAETVELVLVEVKQLVDHAGHGEEIRRQPFSLFFRGAHRFVLPQYTYSMEHPALGALEIFLVPVGPDGQGMCYQAVFN